MRVVSIANGAQFLVTRLIAALAVVLHCQSRIVTSLRDARRVAEHAFVGVCASRAVTHRSETIVARVVVATNVYIHGFLRRIPLHTQVIQRQFRSSQRPLLNDAHHFFQFALVHIRLT
jgi:hypothetical protein